MDKILGFKIHHSFHHIPGGDQNDKMHSNELLNSHNITIICISVHTFIICKGRFPVLIRLWCNTTRNSNGDSEHPS